MFVEATTEPEFNVGIREEDFLKRLMLLVSLALFLIASHAVIISCPLHVFQLVPHVRALDTRVKFTSHILEPMEWV